MPAGLDEEAVLAGALEQARRRETQSRREGTVIRSGVFKYPADLEELRWRHTRDILHRIVPGANEDPVYLEILARQAASIELVLMAQADGRQESSELRRVHRVLIGTVPDPSPEIFSQAVGDDSLVVLSDGFISFLYQSAKSVVLSWRPVEAGPGRTYAFRTEPPDIESVLAQDPYPQELLYRTLHAWLFDGHPRAIGYSPPADRYVPPLELLITLSERFSIAHEYAHALLDTRGLPSSVPPTLSPSWIREFRADQAAFILTANSGEDLDRLPPNIALQGAFFTLVALEVMHDAEDVVRCGRVREDMGSKSHPPLEARIELLKRFYRERVGPETPLGITPEGSRTSTVAIDLAIKGALVPAETLQFLWRRIEPRFVDAHRSGTPLHPIWGSAPCP